MAPSSNQSVAYGTGPEWPTHGYSENLHVPLYSLNKFLDYDDRPFSERLAAGRPYKNKEPVESALHRWEQCWSTIGKRSGTRCDAQSHGGPIVRSKDITRGRFTEAELARRLTEWILNWLRRWAASTPLTDGSSGASRTSGSGHALGAGGSSRKSHNSNAAGKRRGGPGKDGGKDNNGQSKKAKASLPIRDKRQYLACPFLKRNPQGYAQQERCCRRWPNVSRLKTDHIYQCHQVPGVQCPRCGGIIDNHNKSQHVICAVREFQPREGADSSMMQELRSKSTARNESEEEKWHAVYEILFGVPREHQPDPYPDSCLLFRQEIANFVESRLGPLILRSLQTHSFEMGWQTNVSRDVTSGIVGLINRDFHPSDPVSVTFNSHDRSPSTSSGTRDGRSSSYTNRSYTEDGYSHEFSGNIIPGELLGGGSGTQTVEALTQASANDLESGMGDFLSETRGWNSWP
ncbi:hypothetical protein F5B19DRAFT_441079 [Rostrohypoxylon terebratum]|nr:hypothetical protein F5B19DRAFT_441079 [Rostrohypoxylon terebratum]